MKGADGDGEIEGEAVGGEAWVVVRRRDLQRVGADVRVRAGGQVEVRVVGE